eukprot:1143324-Pelagomonas_calceolata.AAC.4
MLARVCTSKVSTLSVHVGQGQPGQHWILIPWLWNRSKLPPACCVQVFVHSLCKVDMRAMICQTIPLAVRISHSPACCVQVFVHSLRKVDMWAMIRQTIPLAVRISTSLACCVQVFVHSLRKVDMRAMIGQTSVASVVVRGAMMSRRVAAYATHPDELQVCVCARAQSGGNAKEAQSLSEKVSTHACVCKHGAPLMSCNAANTLLPDVEEDVRVGVIEAVIWPVPLRLPAHKTTDSVVLHYPGCTRLIRASGGRSH